MQHSIEEKKPPQEHIASIYKEYTTPSRVLRSFTNIANTVIQTALNGQNKYLFEILQNADDAYENQHDSIEVKLILKDNYLIVHHNGKGFDFSDVERICDYASQIEEVKATDLRKTGYKGLGFKSLFNLSDCIYIYSNGYSFRFDKGYWSDPESKPWQVIPIWCEYEELPLIQLYSYDEPVNLILKVNDVTQLESQLRELVDQPELLLYLFRINELSVCLNEENHFLERRIEKFGVFNKINFYKNQNVVCSWISKDYVRPVSTEVQTSVQGASRFIYPEKIKNATEVTFSFALRSDDTVKEISNIRGLCYCTLPTQLHLTFPYHINSQFILNLDRTQLHENEWNEFLVYQLGYLQLNLLKDLAEVENLKNYVIQLFVREIIHPYSKFRTAFSKGFMLAKEEICWLPSYQDYRLLKLGEVWTDTIEFFKQNFQNIWNGQIIPYLINYEVKGQQSLFSIEAKYFTCDQLLRDFPNLYYIQLNKGAYRNFMNYLYDLYERLKDTTNTNNFKETRFLVAKDGTLVSPRHALLEESGNPIPNFFMLNTIDNERLPLSNIESIKNWLAHLGARRLSTRIEVLRESIFKWIDSGILGNRINTENHVGIMNYLAQSVGYLTNKETEKLQEKLLILTESNQFKLAKLCYFHDAVSVKDLLNISEDQKISSSYDMKNLREFFILVGVTNKLENIDVLRRSILIWIENGQIEAKLTINNYTPIIEFLASNYFREQYNLEAPEIKELEKMPVLTCGQTFQKAQDCYFESAVPEVKWLDDCVAKNKLVSSNHSNCVDKFLTKIGVKKHMTAIEVIRGSILKWIQEGNATKRITEDNHHDILKYVGERWDIENYQGGLKLKEIEDLKKMPILTDGGAFRAADSCYSNCKNIPGIKSVISPDEFVSTNYSKDEITYLLKLGVRIPKFTNIYERYSDHLEHSDNMKWFFSRLVKYWKLKKNKEDPLLMYLQQKFRASSCLLAKDGKMYSSTELHSSRFYNIYDIDRNSILLLHYQELPDDVLHYEEMPEDLEDFLGFQTDLDLKCIKQLLEAVDKNQELGQRKTLLFFTTMLEQLRKKDKNEIIKSQLRLLSLDNTLKFAKDLNYFIEANASCSLKSCYLKRIYDMSHEDTLELAELCGVNILPFDVKIMSDKKVKDNSLKEFYLKRLSFIVLQESTYLREDANSTLKLLYDKVSAIELYECDTIQVIYPFGTINKNQKYFKDLTLYVVGEWSNQKTTVLDHLKYMFGLKTDLRNIMDMKEPIDQNRKDLWLDIEDQCPQKLEFIENSLKNLMSNEEKEQFNSISAPVSKEISTAAPILGESTSVEPDTRWLNQSECKTDRERRVLVPEMQCTDLSVTDSSRISIEVGSVPYEVKFNSENLVFTFLQDHYKNKYTNSQFNLDGGIFTLEWQSNIIEIVWVNASEEKGYSYDILIKKGGEVKRLIEVKSTNKLVNNSFFYINHHTFIKKSRFSAELPEHKEKYCIYLVYNGNYTTTAQAEELDSSTEIYKVVLLNNS